MQEMKLNTGAAMPVVGLGLWLMKDKQECISAVDAAISAGYRHFDTAQRYENEAFLGEALAASTINREDLFVTTKIAVENMRWPVLVNTFEQSLANLRMQYVDLLLLHFPATEWRRPAWSRMEELAQSGKAKAIGVSNYTIRHLEELLKECTIKPAVNQVELHVYLQQPELLEYCNAHDIVVQAYSPLAHGYGIDNPMLIEIGKKYGKTAAQIMIKWCLQVGAVPLPKSANVERIAQNTDVFNFELDATDMKQLASLDKNYRTAWDPTNVG